MRKQIADLIDLMAENNIGVYVITDCDDHISEYTSAHFHVIKELSGFIGGCGRLAVCRNGEAALWTDGRYFVAAEAELKGSGIELMKMGERGVPKLADWISERLPAGGTLAFDGRCMPLKEGSGLKEKLPGRKVLSVDLVDQVWKERPREEFHKVWVLDRRYCGRSAADKIGKLRQEMAALGADAHIIASVDDIAWLLNLRGSDIPCNPVFMSYLLVTAGEARLYIDDAHFGDEDGECRCGTYSGFPECGGTEEIAGYSPESGNSAAEDGCGEEYGSDVRAAGTEKADGNCGGSVRTKEAAGPGVRTYLESLAVDVRPYDAVFEDLAGLEGIVRKAADCAKESGDAGKDGDDPENKECAASSGKAAACSGKPVAMYASADRNIKLLIDPSRCNYGLIDRLPECVGLIETINPTARDKCVKNPVEIKNLRIAQHKDSVALTRFMHWFKLNVSGGRLTEKMCAERLHEFRAEQEGFLDESFDTISAYGPNAAMVHYEPAEGVDVEIRSCSLYLVDSGGQYPEGTTDVTRTWSCGTVSDEEREHFTLVAMAHLRLADARFPEGISGAVLDGTAREVLWKRGLDYNHGTGHGVGFCLNVHEAPVGIRCRAYGPDGAYPLKEGMYLSDEPGIYIEGKYGIRTENLLLVVPDYTNEFGRFMKFETMNFCPIDRDCLDIRLMEERDIGLLNHYHKRVYEELEADMDEDEREWLKRMCEPVGR